MNRAAINLSLLTLVLLAGHLGGRRSFIESRNAPPPRGAPLRRVDVAASGEQADQDDTSQRRWPVGLATVLREAEWGRGAVGLRQLQRRPSQLAKRTAELEEQFYEPLNGPDRAGFERPRRVPVLAGDGDGAHKFFYVLSPISQLAQPIQTERLKQGFKNLVPLPAGYQVGLERVSDTAPTSGPMESAGGPQELAGACATRRELVQLTRDETDPASGQLVGRCSGQVELNTCEGSCQSGVQPSVKSPSGFAKVSPLTPPLRRDGRRQRRQSRAI